MKKSWLTHLCIFTLLSYIMPAMGLLFLPFAFVYLVGYIIENRAKGITVTLVVLSGLVLFRLFAFIYLYSIFEQRPPPSTMAEVHSKLGIIAIGVMPDVGFADAKIRAYRERTEQHLNQVAEDLVLNDYDGIDLSKSGGFLNGTVDPYSPEGLPVKWRLLDNKQFILYSIGLDKKDDGGVVVYDATNGSWTPGDLIRTLDSEERLRERHTINTESTTPVDPE